MSALRKGGTRLWINVTKGREGGAKSPARRAKSVLCWEVQLLFSWCFTTWVVYSGQTPSCNSSEAAREACYMQAWVLSRREQGVCDPTAAAAPRPEHVHQQRLTAPLRTSSHPRTPCPWPSPGPLFGGSFPLCAAKKLLTNGTGRCDVDRKRLGSCLEAARLETLWSPWSRWELPPPLRSVGANSNHFGVNSKQSVAFSLIDVFYYDFWHAASRS